MRIKEVEFAGKKVTVREMKIKELNALAEKIGVDFDRLLAANSIAEAKGAVIDLLKKKLPVMFPGIEPQDVEEAYPSEIEALFQAFVDCNFFGARQAITYMLQLAQKR